MKIDEHYIRQILILVRSTTSKTFAYHSKSLKEVDIEKLEFAFAYCTNKRFLKTGTKNGVKTYRITKLGIKQLIILA